MGSDLAILYVYEQHDFITLHPSLIQLNDIDPPG